MGPVKFILLLVFAVYFNPLYSQVWKQYADSAKIYADEKNTDNAVGLYCMALQELKKDSIGKNSYLQLCREADIFCVETKEATEKQVGKYHPYYAQTCEYTGGVYRMMEQYDKAEALFLEAHQIWLLIGKENQNYIYSCVNLAGLYSSTKQYEKAEPLLLEAKPISEKLLGKENRNYLSCCYNLGFLYKNMGQYQKAEPLLLEARQISKKLFGKKDINYVGSCDFLASLYMSMGEDEKAEPLFLEAKLISEKQFGKKDVRYAGSCTNLAILYESMWQYDKAQLLYQEAKQIDESLVGKKNSAYASSCINLANLYFHMGESEKAEPLYLEAKQIREEILGNNNKDYAASCSGLARFYQNIGGQYSKAEPLYIEAKQILENLFGKENVDYAFACMNLGDLYNDMEQYEKAAPLYLETKQIFEKMVGKDDYAYAAICDHLGVCYKDMGQYEKAEPLCVEAKQIRQKVSGKKNTAYGESCENLAALYWVMHQPLKAEEEFKESFSANVDILNSFFQFTNEKEKTAFTKNISLNDKAYSFYLSEKIKSELPYSLSLFYRNMILSSSADLQKRFFYSNDTALINKYNNWIDLKKYLSTLYSEPVNERKEDPVKIEESAGQLEKELVRLSAAFKTKQIKTDWNDIQNKLKPDEASIEFIFFHYNPTCSWSARPYYDSIFYAALILRRDSLLPSMIYLFKQRELTNLLSNTGNKTVNDGVQNLYVSRGVTTVKDSNAVINKSIYDLVWAPLENELKGIKTIYFAPSGTLHRIAFAALPVNEKEVLSDQYKLVELTTTASVTDQTPAYITSSDTLKLYGGIEYNGDSTALKQAARLYSSNTNEIVSNDLPKDVDRGGKLNYLPGTATEVENIKQLSETANNNVSISSGINATEESFKALNGKASPSVIHIATHGFFFPDPKDDKQENSQQAFENNGTIFKRSDNPLFRSGLLLSGANYAWEGKPIQGIEDGILTAYEVSNMYLPNTKLVVLSACETALGDINGSEGVYGLQRAFKMAGVKNLVMSLWKVPDAETAEFMQNFYQNLFAKESISDAFYNAQTIMKNKYRNEPYKWAAWVLIR